MASSYVIEDVVGQVAASATETIRRYPLGLEARGFDNQTGASSVNVGGGKFIYCQGSNVASIGQFVQISNNSAVLLAAANSTAFFPIGVAAGNLSATNVFGWVQVQGIADYCRGTNSSIGAGVNLYICAGTAGLLVTNVVAGNHVIGAVAPVSYTSSQSANLTMQLQYPQFIGVTASI